MMVGVLGGGQLGRMLALAGYPLGFRFRFLDPSEEACAGDIAERWKQEYEDQEALARFACGLAMATYEFENVPIGAVRKLEREVPVYPAPGVLEASQDRISEKSLFARLGIPVPIHCAIERPEDWDSALHAVGLPAILKTRRMGYDGKGQMRLQTAAEADQARRQMRAEGLILEAWVPFDREVSLLAARGRNGAIVFYPLVENHHHGGILRLTLAPAPALSPALQQCAQDYVTRILESLDYVGVLAVEFFERQGRLIANEMAPRVHNSGHWTIEGAETSQFENHLRAIAGLPLGTTTMRGCAAMLNLIGDVPDTALVLAHPDAHLHLYGKTVRPGRKLGHITLCSSDPELLQKDLARLTEALKESRTA